MDPIRVMGKGVTAPNLHATVTLNFVVVEITDKNNPAVDVALQLPAHLIATWFRYQTTGEKPAEGGAL